MVRGRGGYGHSIGSSSMGRGKSAATKLKTSKKRDQRTDLVEIWMTRNNALEEVNLEVKKRYGEVSLPYPLSYHYYGTIYSIQSPLHNACVCQTLKIRKSEFWDLMKRYSLKSSPGQEPDIEKIGHHIKEHHQ